MQLKSHSTNSVAVLELTGSFDSSNAAQVAALLEQAMTANPPRVVVNLAKVTSIDSTALATLVQGLHRCQARRGSLHLCGLQQPVFMVFELTRLSKSFSIFVDEEHAVRALAQ
jgi:anti-sigma B factor antagonist